MNGDDIYIQKLSLRDLKGRDYFEEVGVTGE
jgi:hypothetical protein